MQQAQWRVARELLHTDDRPPHPGLEELKHLCDTFLSFCYLKLKKIVDDIRTRLLIAPDYHFQPLRRLDPSSLDVFSEVTVEVVKMLCPPRRPFSLLKSSAEVMAPLIARLANLTFSSGVFPIIFEARMCHAASEKARAR